MEKRTFSINENDKMLVKAYGNLMVQEWENADLGIKAGRHELKISREENLIVVTAMDNCELFLPAGVELTIERIGGRASVHGLTGSLRIVRVGGDLTLENTGPAVVEKVGGRAAVRRVASLTLEKVGGRCVVEEAAGAVSIGKVGGDCFIKGAAEVGVSKVGGDVDLKCLTLAGSIAAGGDLNLCFDSIAESAAIKAGGDVRLYLPGGAKVNLDITSNGEDIHIKLGDQNLHAEEETYIYSMGDGLPLIKIAAGGDVKVSDAEWVPSGSGESFDRDEIGIDWDFGGLEDVVSKTVEAAVSSSTRFADLGARIGEKAARKGEAAARRAERKIEWMMRSIDRRGRREWSPPAPPTPPRSGVSEEERIAVLQMLQEKSITLEEAERLLDALESYSE